MRGSALKLRLKRDAGSTPVCFVSSSMAMSSDPFKHAAFRSCSCFFMGCWQFRRAWPLLIMLHIPADIGDVPHAVLMLARSNLVLPDLSCVAMLQCSRPGVA